MKPIYALALVFMLACQAMAEGPFNTSVLVTEIEATFAKSASVEPMSDKVAIFMVEPDGVTKQGIELAITSDAKAMIVEARLVAGRSVPVYRRASGTYYFFGASGEYEVGIYQFAVDVAYKTLVDGVFIGPKKPPIEPPPPAGNFDELKKIVNDKIKVLNDPEVAKALGKAYSEVISNAGDKTREVLAGELRATRAVVMRDRVKLSRAVAWNTFIEVVDVELKRVATSIESFRSAVKIVADLLTE